MADKPEQTCTAELNKLMPEKPWNQDTPAANFEPLVNLIDQQTQSDMFRHIGKYQANGDYYDTARDLEDQDKDTGETKFPNGVNAKIEQSDGWPTKIVLEDKAADLKETVTMNDTSHTITSDKVEHCGVSRTRLFGQHGEYFRSYGFPGGSVEKSGALPVLKVE